MEALDIHAGMLAGGFGIGAVFGAVAHRSHFCTMGAVSDWVNMGSMLRLRMWLLASAVALAGVALLEGGGWIDLAQTRPPYRAAGLDWLRHLLGGLMFGAGMTLAGGCTSKNLVRLGAGNLKALVVLAAAAAGAFAMTRTDLYAVAFRGWMAPLVLDLRALGLDGQDLGSLTGWLLGVEPTLARGLWGFGLAAAIVAWVLAGRPRPAPWGRLASGAAVGLCVVAAWALTGGAWGRAWQEEVLWLDQPPAGVGVQSYTSVNPMGEALVVLSRPGALGLITFGLAAVAGTVAGAFSHALLARGLRLEWFPDLADLGRHLAGGALMGTGGTLALGCTIGQGVTGVSTLAAGSFLAAGAMVLGAAITLKVQYHRMLDESAPLHRVLVAALADLGLLPRRGRPPGRR